MLRHVLVETRCHSRCQRWHWVVAFLLRPFQFEPSNPPPNHGPERAGKATRVSWQLWSQWVLCSCVGLPGLFLAIACTRVFGSINGLGKEGGCVGRRLSTGHSFCFFHQTAKFYPKIHKKTRDTKFLLKDVTRNFKYVQCFFASCLRFGKS